MEFEELTGSIIAAGIAVHRELGPGLLKLTGIPVGLLMNFNVEILKDGIRRLFPPPRAREAFAQKVGREGASGGPSENPT